MGTRPSAHSYTRVLSVPAASSPWLKGHWFRKKRTTKLSASLQVRPEVWGAVSGNTHSISRMRSLFFPTAKGPSQEEGEGGEDPQRGHLPPEAGARRCTVASSIPHPHVRTPTPCNNLSRLEQCSQICSQARCLITLPWHRETRKGRQPELHSQRPKACGQWGPLPGFLTHQKVKTERTCSNSSPGAAGQPRQTSGEKSTESSCLFLQLPNMPSVY